MLDSLYSGLSGLQQFQNRLDVIGNNIANSNTVAYKSATADAADSFSQTLQAAGAGTGSMQVGTGVTTGGIRSDFTRGSLTDGIASDLAVEGDGFFIVKDPVGGAQFATRAGDFHVDSNGFLATSKGLRVQGFSDKDLTTMGDIKIDANDLPANIVAANTAAAATAATAATAAATAAADASTAATAATAAATAAAAAAAAAPGDATALAAAAATAAVAATAKAKATAATATATAASAAAVAAAVPPTYAGYTVDLQGKINVALSDGSSFVRGQVLLQSFRDPGALLKQGDNLYSGLTAAGPGNTTPQAPGSNGLGNVRAAKLEMSNVNLAKEFADLITTQRGFQASARMITTSDEILQEVVALKR